METAGLEKACCLHWVARRTATAWMLHGSVYLAPGTEDAEMHSENTSRPRKASWRRQRELPSFGTSKERPRPLSCCGAHCNVPLAPVQNGWVLPKKVAETLKAALETSSSRHI